MNNTHFNLNQVTVGQPIPTIQMHFPLTTVVATAIATRDYQPVHHDLELAKNLNGNTVFINTHTVAGCLERLVMSWVGPNAFLKKIKLRMGTLHHAGDILVLSGKVTMIDMKNKSITVDVVGRNSLGEHVTGEVTVRLLGNSND